MITTPNQTKEMLDSKLLLFHYQYDMCSVLTVM